MADNFLEKQYDDYLARKAAGEKKRRLAWQKQMQAYKKKIARQAAQDTKNKE